MKNEEILKKAIEKAVEGGLQWHLSSSTEGYKLWTCEDDVRTNKYFETIFSHEFAKAFFPKGWTCYKQGHWQDCSEKQQYLSNTAFVLEKWEYYLQEMVLKERPLKYIERFLI